MKKIIRIISLLMVFALMFTCSAVGAFAANSSVRFENQAEKFIFLPGSGYSDTDLFDNFKNMMPGDTRTQTVVVSNNYVGFDRINVYMKAIPHGDSNPLSASVAAHETVASMEDFLSQLSMVVELDGRVIYSASPDELNGLSSNVLLGTIAYGETVKLDVSLSMPIDLGNEYANRIGEVDWVFTVEEVEDPDDPIIPQYARATITAIKLLNNGTPPSNKFQFNLRSADGSVNQTVTNKGSNVVFNSFTYWVPGVYTYYLTEIPGNDAEVKYDTSIYTVTVTVDYFLGYLRASVTYLKDGMPYSGTPVFHNIKEEPEEPEIPDEPDIPEEPEEPESPDPAYVSLVATKTFNKHVAQGSDFTFNLFDADKKAIQTKNNTGGLVIFDRLMFDKEGIYTYYIMEHVGDIEDMVYDTSVYEVTIVVTEKDGKLEAVVSYERNGTAYDDTPAFVNRTREDPEIPGTSDGNGYIYAIIAGVSIVAVIVVLFGAKKKKSKEKEE